MEPLAIITVIDALSSLAGATIEKFERLEKQLKEQTMFAFRYRKACEKLRNETEQVQSLFKTILVRGDDAAISSLLKSNEGQDAFRLLSDALTAAENSIKSHERKADRLLDALKKTELGFGATISSMFTGREVDESEGFVAFMDDAFEALDEHRETVSNLFGHFHELYLIHSVPRRSQPVSSGAEPWKISDSLDTIQLSFYQHPFHIFIGGTEKPEVVAQLHALNASREWAERHSEAMEAMGRRWVEDQLTSDATVPTLGRTQINLMQNLWKAVSQDASALALEKARTVATMAASPDVMPVQAKMDEVRYELLTEIRASIYSALKRARGQKFSIAFCGMVKAGKSLFLNALIGRIILPSDELPSTAWPCRLRHVKDQRIPVLHVDTAPFQNGIRELQKRKYGEMMSTYTPPADDPFAGILDEDQSPSGVGAPGSVDDPEGEKRVIYTKWVDLHPATKENLRRFEVRGFRLPSKAEGEDEVQRLLGDVNDVVRLCNRLNVPIDLKKRDWPLLTVEFDSLRNQDIDGVFEFIDLPGIGESFEDFSFEELIGELAKEVDAVVPIVSFKEVPKEDWRRLPRIINSGIGRAPDLVLCTHLDQISREFLSEQISIVTKVFWPTSPGSTDRVLACSSRMGLSAHMLRRISEDGKPSFKEFWDPKRIEYHCAKEILGVGDPGLHFSHFDPTVWLQAVSRELKHSGLPASMSRLTTDMVMKAQQRILLLEGERLRRHLHKAMSDQKRVLLEMRRSEEDYHTAYEEFSRAKDTFVKVLNDWSVEETRMQIDSKSKLQRGFKILETQGLALAAKAVETEAAGTPQPKSLDPDVGPETLVFFRITDAEQFLFSAQKHLRDSLSKLRRQFVNLVRDLANRSRAEHFDSLKRTIQNSAQDVLQPELKGEIIDELEEIGANVETLVFSRIRRRVVHTIAKRHNPASAYRALQKTIARPIMRPKITDLLESSDLPDMDTVMAAARDTCFDQLGFMVRAPIAVIATVPFVLGAGIWPFVARSKKYLLDKTQIAERLQTHVVRPFLEALKKEGEDTLVAMMKKSSQSAREAVENALDKEQQRYESEKAQKDQPPSKALVATALAALSNFLAAEAALMCLQEYLKRTL